MRGMVAAIVMLGLATGAALAGPSGPSGEPGSPAASGAVPEPLQGIGIDQRLGERVPADLMFRDESGREVRLSDYLGRKPVLLTLNYYRCPMLCTVALGGLVRSLRPLTLQPGKDFTIVTVSIDPSETPELAAAKKKAYIDDLGRPETADGWHFLTGQEPSIAALAASVGFRYRYDAASKQFAHAAGVILLTPEGRIARYFYGIEYAPRDLRLGLVEASSGTIGTLADQILLLCFHYDPATGRYGAAAIGAMRLGGAATVVVVALFLVWTVRRARSTAPPARTGDPAAATPEGAATPEAASGGKVSGHVV